LEFFFAGFSLKLLGVVNLGLTKNTLIEFRDILIASSSIAHNIPLATLNLKHFERIDDLNILE
jgi:predicted nucleic acid-binding protein